MVPLPTPIIRSFTCHTFNEPSSTIGIEWITTGPQRATVSQRGSSGQRRHDGTDLRAPLPVGTLTAPLCPQHWTNFIKCDTPLPDHEGVRERASAGAGLRGQATDLSFPVPPSVVHSRSLMRVRSAQRAGDGNCSYLGMKALAVMKRSILALHPSPFTLFSLMHKSRVQREQMVKGVIKIVEYQFSR